MVWHFKIGKRLVSLSDPSGRDAKAWNSQVLDRIGFVLLGMLAMEGPIPYLDRFGYFHLEEDDNDQIL